MKHLLIVGGAGFIGQSLVRTFIDLQWRVTVFDIVTGRFEHERVRYYAVDVTSGKLPTLPACDAIINLAGATINHRFTPEYKKLIWSSRVTTTRSLRQWVETQPWQPTIYIGASAVGYYGNRGNELLSVNTKPADDLLARICIDWEREHAAFRKINVPVAVLRQGHVFGRGGFLNELLPWYRRGIRLCLGRGDNYVPWIDIRDLVAVYSALVQGDIPAGTYNAVSPSLVKFIEIAKTLGVITHSLIPLSVPLWALRLKLGESVEFITASQRVQSSPELGQAIIHGDLTDSLEYCASLE